MFYLNWCIGIPENITELIITTDIGVGKFSTYLSTLDIKSNQSFRDSLK